MNAILNVSAIFSLYGYNSVFSSSSTADKPEQHWPGQHHPFTTRVGYLYVTLL